MLHRTAKHRIQSHARLGLAVGLCLVATVCLVAGEKPLKPVATETVVTKTGDTKPVTKDATAKPKGGLEIYRQECASCHGLAGEGTTNYYPHLLVGDRSQGQLAAFIASSMPDDAPGTCTGEDAKTVSAYIYDAFYSKEARVRNKPARVELSRLTVNQYVNCVADLAVGFPAVKINFGRRIQDDGGPRQAEHKHGLHARYLTKTRVKDRVNDGGSEERVDATVDFDFGSDSPIPGKIVPDEYTIRWRGSLFAPETGDYDIILDTSNGARLFVNEMQRPFIDAGVRSGSRSQRRESIRLLGGRWYPLRIEFNKGKKEKGQIALKWKPPQRADEVIPARCLSTDDSPEVFVLQTPFPPDDRSTGYERGTSISKAWEQAATDAAIEVAGYVTTHYRQLPGLADEKLGRDSKTREFCGNFVRQAFRRPLTDREKEVYIEHRFTTSPDLDTAVRRVVMMTLKSPRFLYIEPRGDSFDAAARLSLALWDSVPDRLLQEAAAAGRLVTRDQIEKQCRRMLNDPRTKAKLHLFFLQWLKVETAPDLTKDPTAFQAFDASMAADLRTSLELFVDDVAWSDSSDFRQLILADYTYMNGRLAGYYQQTLSGGTQQSRSEFQKVTFEPQERAGILSHPYLMAAFAHSAATSPIHRGVFIARGVLGLALRPPPMAIAPLSPDLQPSLTTRQRVELQTQPDACQSCHATINPLGFALEKFDASGRLRKEEKGHTINATGSYVTRDGSKVKFTGAHDLARFLAESGEVHEAFVEQLFQYIVKEPVRAYGRQALAKLTHSFAEKQYNMNELIIEIAAMAAK